MTRNTPLLLGLVIVAFSLMTAIAVYLFARIYPPDILAPLQMTDPGPAMDIEILGIAPSFLYTLAFALLIGSCARTVAGARAHCLVWVVLASCLEISQHPSIAKPLSQYFPNIFSEPIWEFVSSYWSRGVFDPLDLLATLIGGSIVFILLGLLRKENTDACIS